MLNSSQAARSVNEWCTILGSPALGAQVVEDTLHDAYEEPALFGATVDARNARRLAAIGAG